MYFVFEIHLEKSILYFVFSDQLLKYLIKVFQIHFFKSILYFVFEQSKKSIFYNTDYKSRQTHMQSAVMTGNENNN